MSFSSSDGFNFAFFTKVARTVFSSTLVNGFLWSTFRGGLVWGGSEEERRKSSVGVNFSFNGIRKLDNDDVYLVIFRWIRIAKRKNRVVKLGVKNFLITFQSKKAKKRPLKKLNSNNIRSGYQIRLQEYHCAQKVRREN